MITIARGDEPTAGVSEELQTLIKQLDADAFADREAASTKLSEKGIAGIPALELAIQSESLEVSSRAFEILVKHFQKGNAETKAAAKTSLEKLSSGQNSIARKAKEVLEKPLAPTPDSNLAPGVRILAGGRIIVDGAAMPARARSISISRSDDGTQSMELKDGDRTLKLKEAADKSISGEHTYTKDGKSVTDKIEVKNAAELKEKFPDTFKDYETNLGPAEARKVRVLNEQLFRMKAQLEKIKAQVSDSPDLRERIMASMQGQIDKIEEQLKQAEANQKAAEAKAVEAKAAEEK
jgi:hypothetical protein